MADIAPIVEVLRKEGDRSVADLRASLVNTGRQATGTTGKSIAWDVRAEVRKARLFVTANPSWRFTELGRGPGRVPPYAPIEAWVKARGIGDPKKPLKQRVNAVRFGIAKRGTRKPVKPFVAPALPGIRDRLTRELRPVCAQYYLTIVLDALGR